MPRYEGFSKRSDAESAKAARDTRMQALIVIPVRMASIRLPGKPLADIGGRSMLARMIAAAKAAAIGPVLVAAAEPELAAEAHACGAEAVLTDPALPSGTDRVWVAAQARAEEVILNLQGDMPSCPPGLIRQALETLEQQPLADIATLASPSEDPADRDNPNVVKAVVALGPGARSGPALYFSRAAIPSGPGPVLRHVGLYVYRRAALQRFTAAPASPLEQRERLEQLRALELGLRIEVGLCEAFPKGVDTPEDLAAARAALGKAPFA